MSFMNTITGTTNVGGDWVYKGMENQFKDAKTAMTELQSQKKAIQDDPNMSPADKKAALKDLASAEKALKQALDYTTLGGKYDTNAGSTLGDRDMAAVQSALGRAEAAMSRVEDQLKTAAANASPPVSGPPNASGTSASGGASGSNNTSGTSGSGGTSGSSGASDGQFTDLSDFDVNGMVNMMSTDPQAAMAALKSLAPEDRNVALQMMNTKLQEMNQMFSMMSNMMKSLHDTAKAAINNMRV